MLRPLLVLLTLAVTVGIVASVLAATGDGNILVPPPENVVESFVKQLQSDRYDRALPFLSEELKEATTPADLETFKNQWEEQNGPIEHVDGNEGEAGNGEATASALIRTDRGERSLDFHLTRERYEWKIARLPETE